MKKTAVVTGASGGIGSAISERLLKMEYEVWGIGRSFDRLPAADEAFHPVVCNLLAEKDLEELLGILHGLRPSVLVNNAGTAYYGMHEELNPEKIRRILRTNLEVPMILCQKLLRVLREEKGTIINISSVTALSSSPHGAAYGASKAGLLHFTRTIFDENRKFGVNAVSILPDLTETGLYRNADFSPSEEEGCALRPSDVADAVQYVLQAERGVCINEIVLRPQYHRIQRKNHKGGNIK